MDYLEFDDSAVADPRSPQNLPMQFEFEFGSFSDEGPTLNSTQVVRQKKVKTKSLVDTSASAALDATLKKDLNSFISGSEMLPTNEHASTTKTSRMIAVIFKVAVPSIFCLLIAYSQ